MNTLTINQKNKKNAARIAAFALLIMTIFAGLAFGMIHSNLIVMSDPALTLENLMSQSSKFTIEILAWIVIALMDFVVAVAFFYFFKTTNPQLAKLSAALRILYTLFLSVGIYHLIQIAINLDHTVLSTDIMNHLRSFDVLWSRGLIIFGLHLIVTSLLMFQTYKMPKILSALMLIAGLCYFTVHALYWIAPSIETTTQSIENLLALPMTIGELSFGIWLLVRGSRKPFLNATERFGFNA